MRSIILILTCFLFCIPEANANESNVAQQSSKAPVEPTAEVESDNGVGGYVSAGLVWLYPSPFLVGDFRGGFSFADDIIQLGVGFTSLIYINYFFAELRARIPLDVFAPYISVRGGPLNIFFEDWAMLSAIGLGSEVFFDESLFLDIGVDMVLFFEDRVTVLPAAHIGVGALF